MKILSASQIRELDAYTIAQTPIASIDLMERACRAFSGWFVSHFQGRERVHVVCGTGNNGGDGMGVARMLREQGYEPTCWVVKSGMSVTNDFSVNLERAKTAGVRIFEIEAAAGGILAECDVIIDALFGSGLSRPAEGLYAWVIEEMNRSDAYRVAIDIPSGLRVDAASSGPIVVADYTISFQLPKLAFMMSQNGKYVGDWKLVDIGLHREFIKNADSGFHYTREKVIRRNLQDRNRFDHKGTYGHALLIAGSLGKIGAAVLASRAALRAGLGLLTVHVPRCGNVILQSSVPEAMVSLDRDEEMFTAPPAMEAYSSVGIGPGLGRSSESVHALEFVLRHYRHPMVIDADALNILSEQKELMSLIPEGSILTPHPREFERLAGKTTDDFARLEALRELAKRTRCVVVLKGAYTAIAEPGGQVHFNSTGNPGMATGGTGDTLTGIITGLLAQKYSSLDAARIGVFVHGLSGDLVARELGMTSLIASDLTEFLPSAFLKLHRK
ncbi:NAD(P)H-hydrate dehydratase [Chryseolinea sp. T2]|uniref:NAD(P)H-hydrate dehydratase n=1 Tax=Chryseolinea sp. T2 TaxID=3129255 RepID=UPI003077D510